MEGRDQHEAGTQGELDEKRWEGWEEKQESEGVYKPVNQT